MKGAHPPPPFGSGSSGAQGLGPRPERLWAFQCVDAWPPQPLQPPQPPQPHRPAHTFSCPSGLVGKRVRELGLWPPFKKFLFILETF